MIIDVYVHTKLNLRLKSMYLINIQFTNNIYSQINAVFSLEKNIIYYAEIHLVTDSKIKIDFDPRKHRIKMCDLKISTV